MQHEPRPAIHREKQLWGAPKLGGIESLGVFREDQTVDGVSGSELAFWLCAGGLENGQWPLLTLMPDASFPPFMLLVPFKLLSRCWNSE